MTTQHYLQTELEKLLGQDPTAWQFLQEGSMDGIWYWDLENPDHEWMSPELWKVFGVDPRSKAHNPAEWQKIIFEQDLRVAQKNFVDHCANADHPYDQILRFRHVDGGTIWIRRRGRAIRDANGKAIRMFGAHTDLTAVKRSEENARAGWRAAETANAELKSFAYSVSHDMKAPANTLHLLLSELSSQAPDALSDDAQDILDMSLQTVHRMQRLIEDVLDYTRIIGNEPRFEPVDLNETAKAALSNLRADIHAQGAVVTVGDLPIISGHSSQMIAFFQNIISNAIKFARPGIRPCVDIQCDANTDNDLHLLTFRDNGIGIAPHNQDRIFTLFQRLHGHEEIAGTGIGLPMCQRIAQNHHGDLTLESALGKGATFTLALPWSHYERPDRPQTDLDSHDYRRRALRPENVPAHH